MTITAFKKITLFGLSQDKKAIINQLQTLGCVHLISINPKKAVNLTEETTTLTEQIKKALYYLDDTPQLARAKLFDKNFDADKTVIATLQNQKQLREACDRRDFLEVRIKDLSVWGHFILPHEKEISNIKLWFYKINHKDISAISKNLVIQEVYRDSQFVYIIVLSPDEPSENALPSPRIHTGAIALKDLQQELADVLEKIDDLYEERRLLTRYRKLLRRELARFADRTALQQAIEQTRDHKDFFILQGWIPEAKISLIKAFCAEFNLGMLAETVLPSELPPTLLDTYPWTNAGIELVNFYQTPGYHSLDPSFMVFFSFSIFFAIILADAGYGLIIALFTLLIWRWLGKYNAGNWLRPLLVTISAFSIIYGMLLGSYFGIALPENSILLKIKILDINNFSAMLKFSIIIGCLHIIAANVMRSWYTKKLAVRMQSLSFIILITALTVLAWAVINHASMIITLATCLIIIGLLLLMIFASNLPVTNFKSFIKRILFALESLTHITTLFGDILSYLRLFALALAGVSMAETFNHFAKVIAASSMHGHGWILAFLVILLGQTLNFLLSVMSGVIHGLRLNYIEFFKWSIKEEGYAFAPLKKTEVLHE